MSGLVVTLLYFPLVGLAMIRLLRVDLPRRLDERWAESFLAGVGSTGALMFLLGVAGIPLTRWTFLAAPALALLILARMPAESSNRDEILPYPRLATALLMIPILILLIDAAFVPLDDYDGRAFWVLKGKAIAHERSIDGPFFQGATARNPHSHYPLLLPIDCAAIFALTLSDDDRHVRWLYSFIAVSLLFALRMRLARRFGTAVAAWLVVVLAWTPQFLVTNDGGGKVGLRGPRHRRVRDCRLLLSRKSASVW